MMVNVIKRSASDIMDIERHCTSLRLPSFHLNNCFQNCKWYIHGIQIQLTDRSYNSVSAFIFYLLYHSSYLLIVVHAYVVFKNQLFVGLKVASKLFPLGLITGTVPVDINPANKGKPIEPASKQMFTREDVFSLLEQTEVSESDKNSSSKFFEMFFFYSN